MSSNHLLELGPIPIGTLIKNNIYERIMKAVKPLFACIGKYMKKKKALVVSNLSFKSL